MLSRTAWVSAPVQTSRSSSTAPQAVCGSAAATANSARITPRKPFTHAGRQRRWHGKQIRAAKPSDDDEDEKDGPGDEQNFSIDELASQLSSEAARLRSTMDSLDDDPDGNASTSSTGADNAAKDWATFGKSTDEIEAQVLQANDGGLQAYEFEMFRPLGQIQVQQRMEVEPESPLASTSYEEGPQRTAVLVYTARYYSGMPFQDPVTTLVKEFLPECRVAAYTELQAMRKILGGLPEQKWATATQKINEGPPVVQVLGFYFAEPSMTAAARVAEEGQGATPENLWMVYKWEALRPLSLYPSAEQEKPFSFFGFSNVSLAEVNLAKDYLRAVIRGCLQALSYCHSRGVTHGSVGAGCILLSTLDNREADILQVKLDNFGLAKCSDPAAPGRMEGEYEDCFAMGITLLETTLQVLGRGGRSMEEGAVQRLVCDVFKYDMDEFRNYCEQEGDLSEAVKFLGENSNAGWQMIRALVSGESVNDVLSLGTVQSFLEME